MRLIIALMLLHGSVICLGQDFKPFQRPYSRYAVNPDSCIRIEHTSGSMIFIEAKAIRTAKKKVEIIYREYLTPLDMLVHGIQMNVRIGSDLLPLESSGMFEIYAVDGTDTLQFDKSKRMEVRLAGANLPKPGMEGFRYNRSKRQWESYTSLINNQSVVNDDDQWGTSMPQGVDQVESGNYFGSAQETVREQVFQGMELDDFGFYNYDRVIEGLEYVYFQPQFVTSKKAPIQSTVFVVYDDINSIFYFPESTWAESFFLIKDKSYRLFTVTQDAQVLQAAAIPDLSKVKGTTHSFTLNALMGKATDRNTLSQLTGIQ